MVRVSVPFRHWKICYELVLWILVAVGILIFLVEFSYNNSYHTAISITIRALYEAKLRSPEIWTKGKIETARVARKAMLIRGVSLLNSKLETECYLRYLHGREWYDLVRKESWHPHIWTEFEIVERVGPVAYRLKLPQELSCVHDTFHVSNLKKCLAEPDVQVPLDEIEIDENLRFVEEPIEIMERDVKKLKRRRIHSQSFVGTLGKDRE
ncbi:hypothetical protein Tco_1071015 [Tanacetum coccineum]|uniref:Tf2-1-like SH3-like domain-containing protein n=1 Tax=Tanacetum coccineum TaxID=301880 RepID=A0ABQ5HN29_9ASTR